MKNSAVKNISVTASAYPPNKEITLLSVKGFIDTTTAPEFDRSFQSVLGEKKYKLVIDLKQVDYISSAGWGIFIGEIKRIRSQKGNLFLASMSPEVTEAYELLDFDSIIKAFPNVEQAVQKGFGKIASKKGTEGSRMEEEPLKPQAEKTPEKPLMEESPVTTPTGKSLQKSRWFMRVFKPWKWF